MHRFEPQHHATVELRHAPPATKPCDAANTSATNYISSYQCGLASQFIQAKINQPTVSARLTDVGLYAEDDWKAKPNLTITYGIRFEAQNQINSSHDVAPRLSFAYGIPRKNGQTSTVIRGGYGFFYDRFALCGCPDDIAAEWNQPSHLDFQEPRPGLPSRTRS